MPAADYKDRLGIAIRLQNAPRDPATGMFYPDQWHREKAKLLSSIDSTLRNYTDSASRRPIDWHVRLRTDPRRLMVDVEFIMRNAVDALQWSVERQNLTAFHQNLETAIDLAAQCYLKGDHNKEIHCTDQRIWQEG